MNWLLGSLAFPFPGRRRVHRGVCVTAHLWPHVLKLHLESRSASFSVTTLHQSHTGAECNTHVVLRASKGHQRPAHPQTLSPGEATAHHFSADGGGGAVSCLFLNSLLVELFRLHLLWTRSSWKCAFCLLTPDFLNNPGRQVLSVDP